MTFSIRRRREVETPPAAVCEWHPRGTMSPCPDCATARAAQEQWVRERFAAESPTPPPPPSMGVEASGRCERHKASSRVVAALCFYCDKAAEAVQRLAISAAFRSGLEAGNDGSRSVRGDVQGDLPAAAEVKPDESPSLRSGVESDVDEARPFVVGGVVCQVKDGSVVVELRGHDLSLVSVSVSRELSDGAGVSR